jgi:hypothetical protein
MPQNRWKPLGHPVGRRVGRRETLRPSQEQRPTASLQRWIVMVTSHALPGSQAGGECGDKDHCEPPWKSLRASITPGAYGLLRECKRQAIEIIRTESQHLAFV